jgi:hypothetical protein
MTVGFIYLKIRFFSEDTSKFMAINLYSKCSNHLNFYNLEKTVYNTEVHKLIAMNSDIHEILLKITRRH